VGGGDDQRGGREDGGGAERRKKTLPQDYGLKPRKGHGGSRKRGPGESAKKKGDKVQASGTKKNRKKKINNQPDETYKRIKGEEKGEKEGGGMSGI